MSAKTVRILLVFSAAVLFVLLFIAAPRTASLSNKDVAGKSGPGNNANLEIYLNMAQKGLDENKTRLNQKWLTQKNYDSLSVLWSELKRPDFAAHYVEKKAAESGLADDWLEAGNRYFYAVRFTQDKSEVPVLYQCATRCFEHVLKLKPQQSEAKIMLASCYVEGTDDPMKGISLLREVEKTDSNNVKLQMAFAFFSVKSGQLDKAIERFGKALKADSAYTEAYLHMADAYEQQGNKLKTIEMLEKYALKTNDVTVKLEVEKYIKRLKNNTN